jgi:predicted methyltransferase
MKARSALLLAACWVLGGALALNAEDRGDALAEALARADRPTEDRARDAGRRPVDVIAFLGIEPGMTVIDLIAAGGYYTEVLSGAVGPSGRVYAQNSEYVLKIREGANDKAMTSRLAGSRLPNVERLDRELAELGLAPASVDAALTALNFHDIYNGGGQEVASRFLATVFRVLKPGGVLGLIDHVGDAGTDNTELHRIDEALVEAAVKSAGFRIEAKSDVLRNPDDDHSKNVFDPTIRGRTDRFVMRLRKPEPDAHLQSGDLKTIMVGLGEQMGAVQAGLWLENFEAISHGARAVAAHPHVSPVERARIQEALGPDFPGFASGDRQVHDGAVRLTEAAQARDLDATLREVQAIQAGCVSCHTQFRARLLEPRR